MNNFPYLSIVVPAHNEAERIERCVHEITMQMPAKQTEIVIVENGSVDQTWHKCTLLARQRNVRITRIKERSKALAIVRGMEIAHGQFRYMCDADLSTPVTDLLNKFMPLAESGIDIVIGSRTMPGGSVRTSLKRKLIGRVFNGVIRAVTGLEFHDTQCGFKMFSASAAMQIFPLLKMHSPAFDVEILWLAQRLGFSVMEIPVTWVNEPHSAMRLVSDSWKMFRDVMSLPSLHADLKSPQRVTS